MCMVEPCTALAPPHACGSSVECYSSRSCSCSRSCRARRHRRSRTGFAETQVASGLASPTAMAFAPDGRLFVAEQGGSCASSRTARCSPTPFLTVTVDSTGERGLLGVAFDPDFATNQFVYVYYTATTPSIHNRVSRFTAIGRRRRRRAASVILDLDRLSSGATNHNGGAIHFGPDGKLYIAVGDNANATNAQTLDQPARQDPAHQPRRHRFPPTTRSSPRLPARTSAIWALGLRNPFTFSFQPGTGRMFINDVGAEHLGGDQRRHRRLELRLAHHRGPDRRPALPQPDLRLSARQHPDDGLRDHRRRVLQPAQRAVPGLLRRRLLLRRLLRRLDPQARSGRRKHGRRLRLRRLWPGRPRRRTRRRPLLPDAGRSRSARSSALRTRGTRHRSSRRIR